MTPKRALSLPPNGRSSVNVPDYPAGDANARIAGPSGEVRGRGTIWRVLGGLGAEWDIPEIVRICAEDYRAAGHQPRFYSVGAESQTRSSIGHHQWAGQV